MRHKYHYHINLTQLPTVALQIGSCQVLSRHSSREEIQKAYIALETLASFNQSNMTLQDTADAAQMRVYTWQPSSATDFTEMGLLKAEQKHREKRKQFIFLCSPRCRGLYLRLGRAS